MSRKEILLLCDSQQEEPDEWSGLRPVPWEPWGEILWGDPIKQQTSIKDHEHIDDSREE